MKVPLESDPHLYVLAGRNQEAEWIARHHNIPRAKLIYIHDRSRLYGIDGNNKTLYLYGTWLERRDYRECMEVAKTRGFKIIAINDEGQHVHRYN